MEFKAHAFTNPRNEKRNKKKNLFRIRQNKPPHDRTPVRERPRIQPPFSESGATLLDEEGFPLWKLDDALTDEEGFPGLSLQSSLSERRTSICTPGQDAEGFPVAGGHSMLTPWQQKSLHREVTCYSYPCGSHIDLESGEWIGRQVSPMQRFHRRQPSSIPDVYIAGRAAGRAAGSHGYHNMNSFAEVEIHLTRRNKTNNNGNLENT